MKELKEINVEEYETYAFDIFDTIISRKVHPEYVKKVWCGKIIKLYNLNLSMESLYKLRNEAEIACGTKNCNLGKDFEYTYEEIINYLYAKIKINGSKKDFYENCINIEINEEIKVLYVNEDVLELIKRIYNKKKNIICISDMYLSKDNIKTIFKNLNIEKYFNDYFISCEYLENKSSGNLYKQVINKLNIAPNKMIMIGDNFEKDYQSALNLEINSFHINRDNKFNEYKEYLKKHDGQEIIREYDNLEKCNNNKFQHTIFSLYLFIEKLYYRLKCDKVNKVTFLSREGEYLKKLFDYYKNYIGDETLETSYLIVSRKSTYLPSLQSAGKENFSYLLNQYSWISPLEFLKSINIEENDIELLIKEIPKLDFNKSYGNLQNSKEFKLLINNNKFKKIFEKTRSEQTKNFKNYFHNIIKERDVAIVDIGWHGSMQDNLKKIFKNEFNFTGYYFGVINRNFKYEKSKKAIMMSNVPYPTSNFYLYDQNKTLYEFILGASHGSADHYKLIKGNYEVVTYRKEEEKNLYDNTVKPIQDEMFETFKKLCELLSSSFYDNILIEQKINYTHFQNIFSPSKEQVEFFNSIFHYDNYGVFKLTKLSNQKKLNFISYIKENVLFFLTFRNGYFADTFYPTIKLKNYKMFIPYYVYYITRKRRYKQGKVIPNKK